MAGHSKWATTKHKKAALDAKRGKLFAKLIKNIEVAARTGGADPDANPTLFDAIFKAKKNSVPERQHRAGPQARRRPGGRRRRLADDHVRGLRARRCRGAHRVPHRQPQPRRLRGPGRAHAQRRLAGRPRLGVLHVQPQGRRDRAQGRARRGHVLMAVLDAGAEEVNDLGEAFEVVCEAGDLVPVRKALQDAGIDYDSAESSFLPTMSVPLDEDGAPGRCSGSSTRSRTATTCRTSTPTSTSPTRSWRSSTRNRPECPPLRRGGGHFAVPG